MFRATTPALRMMLASLGAIYAIKAVALFVRRGPGLSIRLAVFLFAWPGVIPDHFRERRPSQAVDPARFFGAWVRMAVGAASILLLAIYAPRIADWLLGAAGIGALLLTIHLGIVDLLPWLLR